MEIALNRILQKLNERGITQENFESSLSEIIKIDYSAVQQINSKARYRKSNDFSSDYSIDEILGNNNNMYKDFILYKSLSRMEDGKYRQFTEDASVNQTYDFFLSHAYRDRYFVLGLYLILTEDMKYSVYVDWITDPYLSKSRKKAAIRNIRIIKLRMNSAKRLLLYQTDHYSASRWIAWEIGVFDGCARKVYLFNHNEIQDDYDKKGVSFLKLYDQAYFSMGALIDQKNKII